MSVPRVGVISGAGRQFSLPRAGPRAGPRVGVISGAVLDVGPRVGVISGAVLDVGPRVGVISGAGRLYSMPRAGPRVGPRVGVISGAVLDVGLRVGVISGAVLDVGPRVGPEGRRYIALERYLSAPHSPSLGPTAHTTPPPHSGALRGGGIKRGDRFSEIRIPPNTARATSRGHLRPTLRVLQGGRGRTHARGIACHTGTRRTGFTTHGMCVLRLQIVPHHLGSSPKVGANPIGGSGRYSEHGASATIPPLDVIDARVGWHAAQGTSRSGR